MFLTGEVQQPHVGLGYVTTCTVGMLALALGGGLVGHHIGKKEFTTDLQANPALLVETLSAEQLQILQRAVAQEFDQRRRGTSENGGIVGNK